MSDQSFTGFEVPINTENEAVIISNAIKDDERREYFYRSASYTLFRTAQFRAIAWAISEIISSGLKVDIDMILVKSKTAPDRAVIDYDLLSGLVNNYDIADSKNYAEYISVLAQDKAKEGILKTSLDSIVKRCLDPKSSLADIGKSIDYAKNHLEDGFSAIRCEFRTLDALVPEYIEDKTKQKDFRTTGFKHLDYYLNEGFKEGNVVTIAGLSGMGKSSFILSCLKNMSNLGISSALFALEMGNNAIITKLLSYYSGISIKKISKQFDRMTPQDKTLITYELERLSRNKFLYMNDKPQSLKSIETQIKILQDILETDYVPTVIDLFGKIKDVRGSKNVAQDYEARLNDVQEMAKSLNTCLILVAQINREVMKRKFTRPSMADLKNSGAFAEVSDLILGVHRPNYDPEKALQDQINGMGSVTFPGYDEEESFDDFENHIVDPSKNFAEIIKLKDRMGEGNIIVPFYFNDKTTCFDPIPYEYQHLMSYNSMEDEGF